MRGGKDDVLPAVVLGERRAGRRLGHTSAEVGHLQLGHFVARRHGHLRSGFRRTRHEQVELVLALALADPRRERNSLRSAEAKHVLLAVSSRPHHKVHVVGKERVGDELGRVGVCVGTGRIAPRAVVAHQVDVVGKLYRTAGDTDFAPIAKGDNAHHGNTDGKGLGLVVSDVE